MISAALLFLAGTVTLQFFTSLPAWEWSLLLPALLAAVPFLSPVPRYPVIFLLGFLWASHYAHCILDSELLKTLEGRDLEVVGEIASIPEQKGERQRFLFKIEQVMVDGQTAPSPGQVRLSWYRHDEQLFAGDRWRLLVRLKQPHGLMNPGGFDYEGWLFRQGIRATGYVRSGEPNQKLAGNPVWHGIDRIRQEIRDNLKQILADQQTAVGVFIALAVGDRSDIPRETWDAFVATGTSHLVAISGLHIGIVAGLGYWLLNFLWRRSVRLMLVLPAPVAAASGSLFFALVYAALAGFTLPTQRALLMLLVVIGSVLLRRQMGAFYSLALALLVVLVFDPLAVLSPGFWLSFVAVFVILLAMQGRLHGARGLFTWIRVQWMVVLGLIPALVISGMTVSLIAPLVNFVLIPLFSVLLVPLVLGGLLVLHILPEVAVPVIQFSGILLAYCIDLLIWLAGLPHVSVRADEMDWLESCMVLTGILLLLIPWGLGGKWGGTVLLVAPFIWSGSGVRTNVLELTLLDVGQGLSLVVQTSNHLLLYDAGPKYSEHFNAGSAVVVPYLRSRGLTQIDRLVLSNGDSDHAGGYQSLAAEWDINQVLSGEAQRLGIASIQSCQSGMNWEWDGVEFQFLSPPPESTWRGNDASCVLSIVSGERRILVTGDITQTVESWLMDKNPDLLRSDLVIIPHHGSLTSSSKEFVEAVKARYALVSTGYANRYGFPKAPVIDRWRASGAQVYDTAVSGAIHFAIDAQQALQGPVEHRATQGRYWHDH